MTKAEQMYALIDARAGTGKTVVEYCAEKGISRSKYNYWQSKRKRAAAATEPAFVPVPTSPRPTQLSVQLPGGLRLDFPADQLDRAADLLLTMDRHHAEL